MAKQSKADDKSQSSEDVIAMLRAEMAAMQEQLQLHNGTQTEEQVSSGYYMNVEFDGITTEQGAVLKPDPKTRRIDMDILHESGADIDYLVSKGILHE